MAISIGLGIGIPMGYPEGGGGSPGETFFVLTEAGDNTVIESGADLIIGEQST